MKVSILTGGADPHYALGLLSGLVTQDIAVDFIGNDLMKTSTLFHNDNVCFHNLRGNQDPEAQLLTKIIRVLKCYIKLVNYSLHTDSKLFHILWFNKFYYFDMIFLNLFYNMMGKKLMFTAHNINVRERDGKDNIFHRYALRMMYGMMDHIFIHTDKMKEQLIVEYGVRDNKITVVPFGINNIIPTTSLTSAEARKGLHLKASERVLLLFGNIVPYKGVEYLILALSLLIERNYDLKLVIVGRVNNSGEYWREIEGLIREHDLCHHIIKNIRYVRDEEVELYFKSADVLILPYKHIFQSGVLFLSYKFGLPVIATDVGSIREDIKVGKTGFVCRPEDPEDLAETIDYYFRSDLYRKLEMNRDEIIKYASENHSWQEIGEKMCTVYKRVL